MAHFMRTRFPKGIVAEFAPPAKKGRRVRAVIIASGMPGVPSKKELLTFFSERGFWVFAPRYRGSWESEGTFLKESPEEDIRIVLDGLYRPVIDLWSGKKFSIRPTEVFVFGSSFGGPAAFFLSSDPRVTRVVALSPVADWRVRSKGEPLGRLEKYLRDGFAGAYRFSAAGWRKLAAGRFYNPASAPERIDGRKTLIVHAKDDRTIAWRPVKRLAEETGAKLILVPRGGHGSRMLTPALLRQIVRFMDLPPTPRKSMVKK